MGSVADNAPSKVAQANIHLLISEHKKSGAAREEMPSVHIQRKMRNGRVHFRGNRQHAKLLRHDNGVAKRLDSYLVKKVLSAYFRPSLYPVQKEKMRILKYSAKQ